MSWFIHISANGTIEVPKDATVVVNRDAEGRMTGFAMVSRGGAWMVQGDGSLRRACEEAAGFTPAVPKGHP